MVGCFEGYKQTRPLTWGFGLLDNGTGGGAISFWAVGDIKCGFLAGGGGGGFFLPNTERCTGLDTGEGCPCRDEDRDLRAVGFGATAGLPGPGEFKEDRRENRDWSSFSWAEFGDGSWS